MNPQALRSGIGFPLFPPEASVMAGHVDTLFFVMLALTGTVTLGIALLIGWCAFRYRRRGPELPPQITGATPLELGWMILPFILFMIPFVWGARLYADMYQAPPDALNVTAIGRQWMWKFEHPGGQREIDQLHVPVGRAVRLTLTSEDVIHSFFVPAFRMKQDVLPGRYTEVWFQASRVGRFHLFCSEYCGTDHSHMEGWVTVMPAAEYQTWLALGASQSMASRGAKLFQQLGCPICHRADSLRRAPVLAGLFGQRVQLSDGRVVTADEDYVRESILDPAARVVLGWQPIMPTFRGRVSEEDMLELIAYIRSLGPGAPRAREQAGAPPPEAEPIFPAPGGPTRLPPVPTR